MITEFQKLPDEIKVAYKSVSHTTDEIKKHQKAIADLKSAEDYKSALAILRDKAKPIIDKIRAEIVSQKSFLAMVSHTPTSRQSKSSYTWEMIDGNRVKVSNDGKSMVVPLSDVGFSAEFVGNQDGTKIGKVAEIGLSHQQGKVLVGKIKG